MKRTYILFLAAAALSAAACESVIRPDEEFSGESAVCFMPVLGSTAGDSVSRSGEGISHSGESVMPDSDPTSMTKAADLVSSDSSISIALGCEVSDGIASQARNDDSAPLATKGTQLNTTGSNDDLSDYSISSFHVKGYKGSATFISSFEEVTKGSDPYWKTAASHPWDATENATFYAYANLPSATGAASVSSSSSANQTLSYDVTKVQAASAQKDILLGFYTGKSRYDATLHKGGIADIKFYHPLTAVRFKLGTFDGNPTVVIKKLSISGVYASGSATMTPTSAAATDPGDKFLWTPGSGTTTVTLGDGTSALSVTGTGKYIGEPFLLIPQLLSAKSVKITVDLTIDGTAATLEARRSTGEWEAGKTNTYTLGYKNYELTVSGEVSTDYKGDGANTYSVNSSADWKLQYTTDGSTWTDATANTQIGGWIKFDKVSGSGSASSQTVTATVTAGTEGDISTDHDAILQSNPAKGTADAPYDLSMHTIYGEERVDGPVTANCYVINAPGWYAFPLVYGNAIDWTKNSTTGVNTSAFAPSGSGTNFLTPFQSSTGSITGSSYKITGATSAYPYWEDVADYALIAEDGCSILSQSQAAAKGLTGCDCGYVVFQASPSTLQQGNAVIAVSNGTDILWSWHIWVTDMDLTCRTVKNTSETFSKGVLPLNLGWVDLTASKGYEGKTLRIRFVQMNGGVVENEVVKNPVRKEYVTETPGGQSPTWQWGRKDPFIRSKTDGTELSTSEYSGTGLTKTGALSSLTASIQNPAAFFYSTTGYGWNSGGGIYDNLWSATLTRNGSGEGYTAAPVKTVYDPCPPGFQVPQMDAFSSFVKPDSSEWETGFKLETYSGSGEYIFFPAPGNRNGGYGSMTGVDNVTRNGRYWTVAPNSTYGNEKYAYHLFVSDVTVSIDPDKASLIYKTYGNSIRPVEE